MLSINTNLSSLIAQNSMKTSTDKLNQAIERMSTGFKINHAKDNAANYSISTNITTKMGAYQVAEDNAMMGLDMIGTASESLSLIEDKLQRLRTLATQVSNGTYGEQSKQDINAEANALVDEIGRLYATTEYNGIKIFESESANFVRRDTSAMTPLKTVNQTEDLVDGTYSISTPEELAQLATMTNSGLIYSGVEFVLAKDIDLSAYSNWTPIGNSTNEFGGNFDGNGYTISDLKINSPNDDYVGLFGMTNNTSVKNLGLINITINGRGRVGGLIGYASNTKIFNSFVTGEINAIGTDFTASAGGLVAEGACSQIYNSFTDVNITGVYRVGGLAGWFFQNGQTQSIISNCFSFGTINARKEVGGLVGLNNPHIKITNSFSATTVSASFNTQYGGLCGYTDTGLDDIVNCYSLQLDNYATKKTLTELQEQTFLEGLGFTMDNGWTIVNGRPYLNYQKEALAQNPFLIPFQIGIGSGASSNLSLQLGFALGGVSDLRMIGLDTTTDYLSQIDKMLNTVSTKQIEYGAAANRLESALEEIIIQYDNLVSSRSTIRDADIAEVSAEYIQQQILQQAAATLMSTANQSPAIALQLI